MKKILLLLLPALLLGGCTASNESYYEHAQLMMGYGDHAAAAELFTQLGEYRDSGEYALYCAGLSALEAGEKDLARANFTLVEGFKSSRRYLMYLDALEKQSGGDLEAALALFEALGSFEDSRDRAQELLRQIPEDTLSQARSLMAAGQYEQARAILDGLDGWGNADELMQQCDQALMEEAYQRAEALYASGDYASARAAFESLGESLDAARRAQDCLDALWRALEADCASATLSSAEELIARCLDMADHAEASAMGAALEKRFRPTLNLIRDAQKRPWVMLGQYPFAESGAPQPLLWRVLRAQDSEAVLLCESVIDAQPVATGTDLILTAEEEAHVIDVALPTLDDLSGLGEEDLSAVATPYAIAQGVRHHSDGRAWWWLNHSARAGRSAIVWYNGRVLPGGVDNQEAAVGMRPLLRLDLETITFASGDGSRERPYTISTITKEGALYAPDDPDSAYGRDP